MHKITLSDKILTKNCSSIHDVPEKSGTLLQCEVDTINFSKGTNKQQIDYINHSDLTELLHWVTKKSK